MLTAIVKLKRDRNWHGITFPRRTVWNGFRSDDGRMVLWWSGNRVPLHEDDYELLLDLSDDVDRLAHDPQPAEVF